MTIRKYNRTAARKFLQVPVVSVVAGVDTVLAVLTVGVVTAVDVAVVSVDCDAVETGVVVCVVTLGTDSDVGGVVLAVVRVDTVAVDTVDSDSVVGVVGAVVLTVTRRNSKLTQLYPSSVIVISKSLARDVKFDEIEINLTKSKQIYVRKVWSSYSTYRCGFSRLESITVLLQEKVYKYLSSRSLSVSIPC